MRKDDVNVVGYKYVETPCSVKSRLVASPTTLGGVEKYRNEIQDILDGRDKRMFAVVGPCSIHDPDSALEYAERLAKLSKDVSDEMLLIMRVYFEKPRTTVGWKGYTNDPDLNDTFNIGKGIPLAREIMMAVADLGLPIGTEALDPLSPQYFNDLVSWSAIGARTTESQTHREMASGLSTAIGFKNATDGDVDVAVNAILSARNEHSFLGVNNTGEMCVVSTKGNAYGHVILRGGSDGTNYSKEDILKTQSSMEKSKINPSIVVDCSHANSMKDYRKQEIAWNTTVENRVSGLNSIKGLMLESHLMDGNQKLEVAQQRAVEADKENNVRSFLEYGKSITDACLNWNDTERLILETARKLKA